MCEQRFRRHPCQHTTFQEIKKCKRASSNAEHCGNLKNKYKDANTYCTEDRCRFSEFQGKWRCHKCLGGPNTMKLHCQGCRHTFCDRCSGWKGNEQYQSIDKVANLGY